MPPPGVTEVVAPAAWHTVDFISDLHLQAAEPATFDAWRHYMAQTPADALFILGDLFEVWVGDDAAREPGFEHACARVLADTAHRCAVYFMAGNRDFLVGHEFLDTCGVHRLGDPCVLVFARQRWLLSHGDALCLADTAYQAFRAQVRGTAWQQTFLARPLQERKTIARELRRQSEALRQARRGAQNDADVDAAAAGRWLSESGATTLIHGHTHRPGRHVLSAAGHDTPALDRVVLSDWDAAARPARAQVLRGDRQGALRRIDLAR